MNIIEACKDENLFRPYLGDNLKTWQPWMTALRVLYGLHPRKWNRQPLGVPAMQWDKPAETPQAAARPRTTTNERGERQSTGQAVAGGSRKPLGAPTFNQLFVE